MDVEEFWEKIYYVVDNSIFIRSGSCNACGECCIAYDKHPSEGGVRVPCKRLVGTLCSVHGPDKTKYCPNSEMNPIYPTICMVPEAIDTCGYSWVIDDTIPKEEAIEMFNRLCAECLIHPCDFHDDIIEELNQ